MKKKILAFFLSCNFLFFSLQQCYAQAAEGTIALPNPSPEATSVNGLGETKQQESDNNDKSSVGEDQAISGVMMAESLISLLTAFIAGFIGVLVAIGCRFSCYRVPSVVIYIVGAAAYIVEEIALYATFMGLSKRISDAKEALKVQQGDDYNEQIAILKQQRDTMYAVYSLETSKGIVLNALNVVFSAAEVVALAEAIVLKIAEKVYGEAKGQATEAAVNQQGAAADELATSSVAQKALAAENEEAADIALQDKGIDDSTEGGGPQCNDKVAEAADEDTTVATTDVAAVDAVVEEEAADLEALGVAECAAAGVGCVQGAQDIEASTIAIATETEALETTEEKNVESKALIQIRKSTLLFCPNLERVEKLQGADASCTTASCTIMKAIIPNAQAASAISGLGTFVEALKLVGIVGGLVLGLAMGLKSTKVVSADSSLYHPITRVIFITVINVLVALASAFAYTAAGISLNRALLIQKLIDRLEKLQSNLARNTPVAEATTAVLGTAAPSGDFGQLSEVEQRVQSDQNMGYDKRQAVTPCYKQNLEQDKSCQCKTKDDCFRNYSEVPQLQVNLPPFSEKDLDPNVIQSVNSHMNSYSRNMGSNNQKQADLDAIAVGKHSAYFLNKKKALLKQLNTIPDGKRWLDMYETSVKNFRDEFKKQAKDYAKNKNLTDGFSMFQVLKDIEGKDKDKEGGSEKDKNSRDKLEQVIKSVATEEEHKQLKKPIDMTEGMKMEDLEDPFDKLLDQKYKDDSLGGSDLDKLKFEKMKKAQKESFFDTSKEDVNTTSTHSIFQIISKRYNKIYH